MNPWLVFAIGLFGGSAIGFFTAALCSMASRRDECAECWREDEAREVEAAEFQAWRAGGTCQRCGAWIPKGWEHRHGPDAGTLAAAADLDTDEPLTDSCADLAIQNIRKRQPTLYGWSFTGDLAAMLLAYFQHHGNPTQLVTGCTFDPSQHTADAPDATYEERMRIESLRLANDACCEEERRAFRRLPMAERRRILEGR